MDVTEFLALMVQARARSKSQLFLCRILSSMFDRIRLWYSTKPLLQGDSAAVVLTVMPKILHYCINFLFMNSPLLCVRNFSAEPSTEIHILNIVLIIVSGFLFETTVDGDNHVQWSITWSSVFP